MPRRAANAAILVFLLAAALLPGAAVSRGYAVDCFYPSPAEDEMAMFIAGYETVVVGTVVSSGVNGFAIEPETFLKGAVTAGHLVFRRDAPGECDAVVESGERLLLFANGDAWPVYAGVYRLEGGTAFGPNSETRPEQEIVGEIRDITEQYAVPPQTASESQGIEWWKTVVPVGAAVLGIFAVGLFLMRIWHRIDPS